MWNCVLSIGMQCAKFEFIYKMRHSKLPNDNDKCVQIAKYIL